MMIKNLLIYDFKRKFKQNFYRPSFWISIFLRIYFRITRKVYTKKSKSIFDKRWDNLIILDACRYDTFKKIAKDVCNELKPFYSLGTHTLEFLKANFKEKHEEVIYLSTNSFCDIIKDKVYRYIPLWKICKKQKYGVILPEEAIKISKMIKKNIQIKN